MRNFAAGLLAALLIAAATPSFAADAATEERAIRGIVQQWLAAVASKDPVASAAFYAEDGMVMPPGRPPAKGRAAISEVWKGMFALKNFHLTFAPTVVRVARSGDIAYDIGTYALTFDGDHGPVRDRGKYVVAWRKTDHGWKAAADIFNSDGPMK